MVIFSYGIPKSGSTLALQLATGIALLGGHWQPRANDALRRPGRLIPVSHTLKGRAHRSPLHAPMDYFLTLALQLATRRALAQGHEHLVLDPSLGLSGRPVAFAETLDPAMLPRLVEATGDRILLIKTHAAPGTEWMAAYRSFAAKGQVRAHVNHRDPRDVCLALLDAGRIARERGNWEFSEYRTLAEAAAGVRRHLTELELWSRLPNTLHLHYEICAFRTNAAIDLIKADLRLRCPNRLVQHYAMRLAYTERNQATPNRHHHELDHRQLAQLTANFLPYLRERGYLTGRVGRGEPG